LRPPHTTNPIHTVSLGVFYQSMKSLTKMERKRLGANKEQTLPPPSMTQGRGGGNKPGRGRSRHGRRRNPHLRTKSRTSAGRSQARKRPSRRATAGNGRNPYPEGGRRGGGGGRRWDRRPRHGRRRRLHRWRREARCELLRAVLGWNRPVKIRCGWAWSSSLWLEVGVGRG
jgi:hypothetical protein